MQQQEFMELFEKQLMSFRPGQIIPGKVVKLHKDFVLVDIGYKSEGMVPRDEFKDFEELEIGHEVTVMLDELEPNEAGFIPLSKERADLVLNWDRVEKAAQENRHVKGKIVSVIKGGFRVDVGIMAFLPMSQTDLRPVADPKKLVGEVFEFKIIKIDRSRNNVVISRREILEAAEKERKAEAIKRIEEGQVCRGVVRNIVDYGAFVDIGDITGLVHINDLSWSHINHPSQVLAVDEEVEVKILRINHEKSEISLGIKQVGPNPWENIEERYPIGTKIQGKVVNITEYGAFVKIEEGVEGLLHISELSWTSKIKHPTEVVAMGDNIEVQIIGLDPVAQKISFSMKALEANPWETIAERYPPGTIIKGKVYNITNYGAFVEIEKGIDGLLHISNMDWSKVGHPSEVVKKGDKLDVMVLDVDTARKRVALGRKQLLEKGHEATITPGEKTGRADAAGEGGEGQAAEEAEKQADETSKEAAEEAAGAQSESEQQEAASGESADDSPEEKPETAGAEAAAPEEEPVEEPVKSEEEAAEKAETAEEKAGEEEKEKTS